MSQNKDNDDDGLWGFVTRNILPLAGKAFYAEKPKPIQKRDITEKTVRTTPAKTLSKKQAQHSIHNNTGIDRKNWERFTKGKMDIDARLDLHGLSEEDAYHAFKTFLHLQIHRKNRCVLIITGKGKGILKNALYRWIDDPAFQSNILKFSKAAPKHGGDGAFYILLRRHKD